MKHRFDAPELLTATEVGRLFGVNARTVTRWAKQGRLDAIRTLGGHRRYRADDIRARLRGEQGGGEAR